MIFSFGYRFIGNVIVGKMHSAEPGRPILLNVVQLEKTNNLTIAALMNNSMNLLWPDGIQHFKVLLFVTDGAAYMVKAGKALRNFYPRMVHVTCLAHGLHRIAETVRSSYPITDKFVSSMKKIFLKAPGRITAFKEQYPEIPLPPKPVIVRWGTWLTTVQYYAKYFNEIELFVSTLDENEAACVADVKKLLKKNKNELKMEICQIDEKFCVIAETITKLETKGQAMSKAVELWEGIISHLSNVNVPKIQQKTQSIEKKNHELENLILLTRNDPALLERNPYKDMSPAELSSFNYAPLVSCDVERSFSMLNSVLRDNRRSFIVDNLKQHLIIAAFAIL